MGAIPPLPRSANAKGAVYRGRDAVGAAPVGLGGAPLGAVRAEVFALRGLAPHRPPEHGLVATRGAAWDLDESRRAMELRGRMGLHNVTAGREVFVPRCAPGPVRLLARGPTSALAVSARVTPRHDLADGYAAEGIRGDGDWPAYILKAGASTFADVEVRVEAPEGAEAQLGGLKAAEFQLDYEAYGPHGLSRHSQHVVLPLEFPVAVGGAGWQRVALPNSPSDQDCPDSSGAADAPSGRACAWAWPLKTHLLTHLDDPADVVRSYLPPEPLYRPAPGDVLAVGESPLAAMQGRWRPPAQVRLGLLARLACQLFAPTSSLATACGMQALVDAVGAWRVAAAAVLGALARVFLRRRGVFYSLAGEQAALLDDLTGSLPPYDRHISLGPLGARAAAEAMRRELPEGVGVAVVDVNDLSRETGQVRVLAATDGVNISRLREALLGNPAGNAAQQTPLVLVRPRGGDGQPVDAST